MSVDLQSACTVTASSGLSTPGFLAVDPRRNRPVLITVNHLFERPESDPALATARLSATGRPLKISLRCRDSALDCAVFDVEDAAGADVRPLTLDPLSSNSKEEPLGLRLQGGCYRTSVDKPPQAVLFDGRCLSSFTEPNKFLLDGALSSHGCSGTALVMKAFPNRVCGMMTGVYADLSTHGSIRLTEGNYDVYGLGHYFVDCLVAAHKANSWTVFVSSPAIIDLLQRAV